MDNPSETALIVAIDGPAGAGKSTIARMLAKRLGLPYIDTGAMYRAVALLALNDGTDLSDVARLEEIARSAEMEFVRRDGRQELCVNGELPGEALRTPEVSQGASRVSVLPGVRDALTRKQREIGREEGCVMEGRDIGSVVFPDADLKLFLTASPQERTRRRAEEMRAKGHDVDEAHLFREIEERDRRDSNREVAPLVPAEDAVSLYTDGKTVDGVIEEIVELLKGKRGT